MSRKKKGVPVVIVRKDKKLNKTGHLLAFALTGGTSSVYTAAKAATNAGYNARTRKLMEKAEASQQAEEPQPGAPAPSARDQFSQADHERARKAGEAAMRRLREGR